MLQDSILIWKLLSLLFFSVLVVFLFYIFLEKLLNRLEFKRRLRFVKDQLLFDIFKDYNSKMSDFLILDEFSQLEIDTRVELNELKKKIFCDLSKYDLKDLEQKVNESFKEKEKKINKIILNKYKDAIKSLNQKVIFLKNELDAFKNIFYEKNIKIESNTFQDNINGKIIANEDLIKNVVDGYLNEKNNLFVYKNIESNQNKNLDLNYIDKRIDSSSRQSYVKLNAGIKEIEKSIENKIDSMLKTRDVYINKQISYLLQNNDKLSDEKMKIFEKMQDKVDKFMKENMDKIYEMIEYKDKIIEEKNILINDQKNSIFDLQKQLLKQNEFLENQIKKFALDKEYLDKYISSLKKQSSIQTSKNNIFIVAIVLLFMITLTMFLLVLTKSPLIYTLY